jgi:hypothetical protein
LVALIRKAIIVNSLFEKGCCSLFITTLRQHEIKRYRDLEEIMEERGVNVDHATLNRWVIRYSPTIAVKATSQKRETNLRENTRPYRYHGLKIFTSLKLRFQDFQRLLQPLHHDTQTA